VKVTTKTKIDRRPAGPGRLSAEQTAELPERLLDAALELFSARGYAGTTMEAIAKRAGASTKTLYSRYPSKESILDAVVTRNVDRVLAAHSAELDGDPRGADPRVYLEALGRRVVLSIYEDGMGIQRLVFAESYRFPELERFFTETVGRGAVVLRNALEQWRREGLLPKLPETERAATLLQIMMIERARTLGVLGDPLSRQEINAHVAYAVDTFLRACGYPPDKET
jgi:AcrR family transcriptional regulator